MTDNLECCLGAKTLQPGREMAAQEPYIFLLKPKLTVSQCEHKDHQRHKMELIRKTKKVTLRHWPTV